MVTIHNASVDLLHPQESGTFLLQSPVIANFLLKFSNFHYRGNRGWSETNFTYTLTVKFADLENALLCARIRNISYRISVIANLLKILKFRYHGNKCQSGVSLNDTVKFADPENFLLKFSSFHSHGNRTNFTQLNLPTSKTPDWCNNRGFIFYTSRVVGNFVFNNSDWLP